jgi:hypothetical protein
MKKRGADWTEDETAMLGKIGDSRLAMQLGKTRQDVKARREALGIPPAKSPGRPRMIPAPGIFTPAP